MLRYIIGGVALAATGYGLKKYLDRFDAYVPSNDKAKNNDEKSDINPQEIDLADLTDFNDSDFLNERAVDKIRKFNEIISLLFSSLKNLQEKLSRVENLPELKSAYSSISGDKILKFNDADSKNFDIFFHPFINSKEDLQILCDLNLMIDYTLECMIENNISKLDLAQSEVSDYDKCEPERQEIIVKLLELNNRLVKALRELRAVTHMQEIATIFKDAANVYKRYYDNKFFKEEVYE